MSLESSLEALAKSLGQHAAAMQRLAGAIKATPLAANWEPEGGALIEVSETAKDLPTEKAESEPVAERAENPKKSEEKAEQPQRTLESARQIASSILKKKGADKLRSLLDEVGVKKLSALNAEQIQAFCANAEKALAEA